VIVQSLTLACICRALWNNRLIVSPD